MTTLVLGVGVSGIAAARLARSLGHDVQFFDERPDASAPSGFQPTSIAVGEWSSHLLDGVDLVITSPGFPPTSRSIRRFAGEYAGHLGEWWTNKLPALYT